MSTKKIAGVFLLWIASLSLRAQDSSLVHLLEDSMAAAKKSSYVTGTFKTYHIINMQTVEAPAKGALNVEIQHRFGRINEGAYNFFGLDNATLRLGLDYGISDRVAVGIGRSSYQKTFDGYLKYKLLRQTDNINQVPVAVSVLLEIINSTQNSIDKPYLTAGDKTAYSSQLLIARKFSSDFSMQVVPSIIHFNTVPAATDKNTLYAVGAGARMKITHRMSINAEYNYLPSGQIVSQSLHNSFSVGWDIETGGHVFQLVFSNSQSLTDPQYIAQTTGSWGNGDIYFGFNISRNFNLSKKAKGTTGNRNK